MVLFGGAVVLMWPLKPLILPAVFEIPNDTDMIAENNLLKYITNMIHINMTPRQPWLQSRFHRCLLRPSNRIYSTYYFIYCLTCFSIKVGITVTGNSVGTYNLVYGLGVRTVNYTHLGDGAHSFDSMVLPSVSSTLVFT